jgi:hypothetical protein
VLLLVAILCGVLAWSVRDLHVAHRRSRLIAAVERLGGSVRQNEAPQAARVSATTLIGTLVSEQLTFPIVAVSVHPPPTLDEDFSEVLSLVRSLPEINSLSLSGAGIDDRALEQLAPCPQLEHLDLVKTGITDRSAVHLAKLAKPADTVPAGSPRRP